jgi:hydroxyacylglutathione hydrolase
MVNRDLLKLMNKGQAPIVVDVRKPSEWSESRIGTVLNLPLNSLADQSGLLDPKEPVVLICRSGYRSGMAVGILEREGFKKATSVDGGMKAWKKAGLPVVDAEKK